ncbi:phosphatase PAP2 family protein [Halothiobacillus sp. DCM-1]|uniref:phosphatase PAP2 family protein n=1 Tax=Halothiobacillus sp. DCM-1 TaxID=3112558 RepID=UPI00324F61D4
MIESRIKRDQAPPVGWRAVARRLRRHMPTKALGTTLLMTGFFVLYLQLLHHPVHPVTIMLLTPVDHWLPFIPGSLLVYFSLWFYVSLPPALLWSRAALWGYGVSIGGVCLLGLLIFWLWPTAVPTPSIDWARYPGFSALKAVDGTGNACPSLHVATAVFSGIWLQALLREMGFSARWRVFNGLWCAAIVISTLTTRQHVFLDALAGLALGGVAAWLSLRGLWRWESGQPVQ